MIMNPQLLAQAAHQHVTELHQQADQRKAAGQAAAARPTIRNRAGWTLVTLGLRMAARSASA
jgi:hypothetical protein